MPTLCKTALKIYEYRRDCKSTINFNREMRRDIFMSVRRQLPGSVHDEGTPFRLNLPEECTKFIKQSEKIRNGKAQAATAGNQSSYQMRIYQDTEVHKNHARDFCKYIYCHATVDTAAMMLTHEKFAESVFYLLKILNNNDEMLLCGELLILLSAFALWEILPNMTEEKMRNNHMLCLRAIEFFNDNLTKNKLEFASIALLTKLSFISRTRASTVLKNANAFDVFMSKSVELAERHRNSPKFLRLLSYAFMCMPIEHLKQAFPDASINIFLSMVNQTLEGCLLKMNNNNNSQHMLMTLGLRGEVVCPCSCRKVLVELLWYLSCAFSWMTPDRQDTVLRVWNVLWNTLQHLWVQERRLGMQYVYCMIAFIQGIRNIALAFPNILHQICDVMGAELVPKLQLLYTKYPHTQRELLILQRAIMCHSAKSQVVHANSNCVCLVNCINPAPQVHSDVTLTGLLAGAVAPSQCIKIESITGVKSVPRYFGDYGDSQDN